MPYIPRLALLSFWLLRLREIEGFHELEDLLVHLLDDLLILKYLIPKPLRITFGLSDFF